MTNEPRIWSDVPPSEITEAFLDAANIEANTPIGIGPRVLTAEETVELTAEVERLRQWKESAMSVLAEWDNVWERLGKPGTIGSSKAMESLKEVEWLRAELATVRGAMDAQDERERVAGERCGVSREQHGCDWPEWVADAVLKLRAENAELREKHEKPLLGITSPMGLIPDDDDFPSIPFEVVQKLKCVPAEELQQLRAAAAELAEIKRAWGMAAKDL